MAEVPKSVVGEGAMRFVAPGGGTEPIGQRIIEVPQNKSRGEGARTRIRGSSPMCRLAGSIAKGEALVTTGGGGKTIPCANCHGGADCKVALARCRRLRGARRCTWTRQLLDIKSGARTGAWTPLMQQVVAKLDVDDVIALVAYRGIASPPQVIAPA